METRKPDFLIVGAAKSGTTSLSGYLAEHPDVVIVSNRLEYFGEFSNPAYGKMSREKYFSLFADVPASKAAGEKSGSYLYSSKAIREIAEMNPAMKIIMVLRDPVERAYSDYWHRRRTGVEALSFEDALQRESQRIKEGARFELHYANYGLYADRVKTYIETFGRSNVCAFCFEDLKQQPEEVCKRCFEFLGVDHNYIPQNFRVYNKGGQGQSSLVLRVLYAMARQGKMVAFVRKVIPDRLRKVVTSWMAQNTTKGEYPPINPETKQRLREFFAQDVEKLEAVLGWDLSDWKSPTQNSFHQS